MRRNRERFVGGVVSVDVRVDFIFTCMCVWRMCVNAVMGLLVCHGAWACLQLHAFSYYKSISAIQSHFLVFLNYFGIFVFIAYSTVVVFREGAAR